MEVSRIRALRGPNLWSRHTSIEAIVACAEPERSIDQLPGFEARLRALFPAIGALPDTSGYYAAVTHSGVTLAPFIGAAVADEILNGVSRPELADFRPGRFFR